MPAHLGEAARRRSARRRRWGIALVVLAVGAVVVGSVALAARLGEDGGDAGRDATSAGTGDVDTTAATDAAATTTATTAAPAVPAGPPDQATLDALGLRLEPVVELKHPTALVQRPGSGDLYAAGVEGPVVRVPVGGGAPVVVADFGPQISTSGESGLLDLAFDATGDLVYVSLVETNGDLALLEVPVTGDGFALERARTLLAIESPTEVHHAGDVEVDAGGLVWLSVGDGGPSQGRSMRAQDLGDLHGKILRIDPRPTASAAYQVPPDNPLVGRPGVRPEIWAYGLRNPWRFHHDPVTGDLWIGDVGRSGREEIDYVAGPRAAAGANFGWPYFEGTEAGVDGAPEGIVGPLLDYPHGERCGITGGAVYRGSAIPQLTGAYLYSDLCDGIVRAVSVAGDGTVAAERAFEQAHAGYPVSFGTDLAGELYLCSFDLNAIYRIAAA